MRKKVNLSRRAFLKASTSVSAAAILYACRVKPAAGPTVQNPGIPNVTEANSNTDNEKANNKRLFVFIGTYTIDTKSEGIYVYRMDSATGRLTYASTTEGTINPSYLALHPGQQYLLAVNETDKLNGQPGGGVSAFSIDPQTSSLKLINQESSHGASPCYINIEMTGKYALVANYGGGNVAMLPILSNGQLGPATSVIQHSGSSFNPDRQEGPHAHSINVDPNNRYAIAADLGIDKLLIYKLNLAQGKLEANSEPDVKVESGAGPRHLAFHPSGRYVYVINELNATINVYAYDGENGRLAQLQTVATLPEGYTGQKSAADIHVHPSGKYVYGSNRGHDSIVIFAVDEQTGKLSYIGHQATQGKTPRNFNIDPSGTYLLVANQDSNSVVVFRIDLATGKLQPAGQEIQVPAPVCIIFKALN